MDSNKMYNEGIQFFQFLNGFSHVSGIMLSTLYRMTFNSLTDSHKSLFNQYIHAKRMVFQFLNGFSHGKITLQGCSRLF